jgi:hypothetical protein
MREIVSADDLTGPYDAIALASANSSRDLFERVLPEIRKLPGVTQALPAPLMGPFVEPSTRTHRFDSSGKAA